MDIGPPLLLSGALLPDGRAVDVRINSGRIEAIGASGSLSAPDRLDLSGYLLLPAPVEAHTHLDEAFGATSPAPGPEAETVELLQRRITEAALGGLGYGATAQRTHVHIGDGRGLLGLEAALQAGHHLHGLMELQTVALPRLLTGIAGAEGRATLRDALALGAHAVGGCPDLDPDPVGFLEFAVALAAEHGRPLDLHTDAGDPVRFTRLAAVLGSTSVPVNLGPCSALAQLHGSTLAGAVDRLADCGLSVTCLPQSSRCVGTGAGSGMGTGVGVGVGGGAGAGGARPLLPAGRLRAAGIAVVAGSGGLRDTANPVGRADPLEAAFLLAASGALEAGAAYAAVSTVARGVLGLPPVAVAVGSPAELLAVRGESLLGVLSGGHSRVVLHAGRVVSRTSAVREYTDTTAPALPRQGRGVPPDRS
jgi:cytosine deaminase